MTYLIENYFKNKELAKYAQRCGIVIDDHDRRATAAELEFLIETLIQDVIENPWIGQTIVNSAVGYTTKTVIEEAENGDKLLHIPELMIRRLNLKDGDLVDVTVNTYGNIEVKKLDTK